MQKSFTLKDPRIALAVQKLQQFHWKGGFCLLVELHWEGSARSACTAGLFLKKTKNKFGGPRLRHHFGFLNVWKILSSNWYIRGCSQIMSAKNGGVQTPPPPFVSPRWLFVKQPRLHQVHFCTLFLRKKRIKKSKSCFCWVKLTFAKTWSSWKNPAYGRQRISWLILIVGLIQFWRGCVIYLQKKSSKIFETIFLQIPWNYFSPKFLKQFLSKIFETKFLQSLWNNFPPKSLKQLSSKIFETNFLQNHWYDFSPRS